MLYSMFSLVIYFTHSINSIYVSMPNSQFTPPLTILWIHPLLSILICLHLLPPSVPSTWITATASLLSDLLERSPSLPQPCSPLGAIHSTKMYWSSMATLCQTLCTFFGIRFLSLHSLPHLTWSHRTFFWLLKQSFFLPLVGHTS